jgi:nucleoside 2-deoxyribosyltransferase
VNVKRLVVGKGKTSWPTESEEWTKEYFEIEAAINDPPELEDLDMATADQSNKTKIYIAGKMEWLNAEDSRWKASLEVCDEGNEVRGPACVSASSEVELVLPSLQWFDHGGDLVEGIVEADIKAVEESDGLIAVFTEHEQNGTLIELLHALSLGKPCLAIFVEPTAQTCDKDAVIISRGLSMRCESDHYWFLINYLAKDPLVSLAVVKARRMALKAAAEWIRTATLRQDR